MQGVHNLCEFTAIHSQLSKLLLKNIVRIDKAPMLVEQPHVVHVNQTLKPRGAQERGGKRRIHFYSLSDLQICGTPRNGGDTSVTVRT
jgi:hypothetical protein